MESIRNFSPKNVLILDTLLCYPLVKMTKTCTKCHIDKELTEFYKNDKSSDGLRYYCKTCENQYTFDNREQVYARHKTWRQNNSEKLKAAGKLYRQNNPEKIKAHNRTSTTRLSTGRKNAKKRGHVWELTIEQYIPLIADNACHYCNGPLPETGHALDRKDNSIGYLIDNVVPCCKDCNTFKGDRLTYEEMVAVSNLLKQMRSPKSNITAPEYPGSLREKSIDLPPDPVL